MRRLLLPALAVAVTAGAHAQTVTVDSVVTRRVVVDSTQAERGGTAMPPSPRRTTTLLLPKGAGVFYYRAGEPGGVRVRTRNGQPVVGTRPAPALSAGPTVITVPGQGNLSQSDLDRLERNLLRALDDRFDDLDDEINDLERRRSRVGYVPPVTAPPVITPGAPLAPGQPTPTPPTTTRPTQPTPPAQPGEDVVTVQEVERALLDTGLFRTSRVNFEFGEATLIPVSREILTTVGDVLLRYPDLRIQVGGHTDSVSSAAYNLQLSQRRADSVVDFLVGYGIDADRLEGVGFGEGQPIASNATETGRALNRRVAFTVLNPEAAETVRESTTTEAEGADAERIRQILREELDRLQREDGDG